MKQPWEKGFIPKPGAKVQWKGPKAPEGWVRHNSTDSIRFERHGISGFDVIVGKPGSKWRLWLNHHPILFRAPDMSMRSLEGLLAWYMVESQTREPATYHGTRTGRNKWYRGSWQNLPVQAAARAAHEEAQRLVEAYRAQGHKVSEFMDEIVIEVDAAKIGTEIHKAMETSPLFADYTALEDRVCKTLAR